MQWPTYLTLKININKKSDKGVRYSRSEGSVDRYIIFVDRKYLQCIIFYSAYNHAFDFNLMLII